MTIIIIAGFSRRDEEDPIRRAPSCRPVEFRVDYHFQVRIIVPETEIRWALERCGSLDQGEVSAHTQRTSTGSGNEFVDGILHGRYVQPFLGYNNFPCHAYQVAAVGSGSIRAPHRIIPLERIHVIDQQKLRIVQMPGHIRGMCDAVFIRHRLVLCAVAAFRNISAVRTQIGTLRVRFQNVHVHEVNFISKRTGVVESPACQIEKLRNSEPVWRSRIRTEHQ